MTVNDNHTHAQTSPVVCRPLPLGIGMPGAGSRRRWRAGRTSTAAWVLMIPLLCVERASVWSEVSDRVRSVAELMRCIVYVGWLAYTNRHLSCVLPCPGLRRETVRGFVLIYIGSRSCFGRPARVGPLALCHAVSWCTPCTAIGGPVPLPGWSLAPSCAFIAWVDSRECRGPALFLLSLRIGR